jgi:hypothetical protein
MGLPQGRRRRRRRRRAGKTISQPSASSLLHTTKETTQCAQNHKIARKERKSHQKNTCKNLTSYYAKEIFEMDAECTTQYYHPLLLVSDTQAKPTTTNHAQLVSCGQQERWQQPCNSRLRCLQ